MLLSSRLTRLVICKPHPEPPEPIYLRLDGTTGLASLTVTRRTDFRSKCRDFFISLEGPIL